MYIVPSSEYRTYGEIFVHVLYVYVLLRNTFSHYDIRNSYYLFSS